MRTAHAEPGLLVLGLLAVLGWDLSGLDWTLSRHFFVDAGGFAARDAFWARGLLHEGLRGLWLLTWLGLGWDAWRSAPAARGPTRAERRSAWLAGLVCLLLVPALKSISYSSCPWSLQGLGGELPWVSHWDWGLRDGGPGHCFPSGHSAGAFAFAPIAWSWRRPRVWLLLALNGALASLAQLARGAHFLSHCLWSAWLCLALSWLLLRWLRPKTVAGRGSSSPIPA